MPVTVSADGDHLVIRCELPRVKDKAMVGTFTSHLTNMIDGVTAGFEYHMKIVYSHFPMKTSVKGNLFIIDNFLGERSARHAKILGDTKIVVKGNDVVLSGIDVEALGQTAANIEYATKIWGYDPRVFQDGIYQFFRQIICINNNIADTMTINPEIFKNPIGDHSEGIQRYQVDQRKGYDDIMAEILKSEHVLVQKQ